MSDNDLFDKDSSSIESVASSNDFENSDSSISVVDSTQSVSPGIMPHCTQIEASVSSKPFCFRKDLTNHEHELSNSDEEIQNVHIPTLDPTSTRKRKSLHATNICLSSDDDVQPKIKRKSVVKHNSPSNRMNTAYTSIVDNNEQKPLQKKKCKYGVQCYRKNPLHLAEYYHQSSDEDASIYKTTKSMANKSLSSLNLFLTSVKGFNKPTMNIPEMGIQDILNFNEGGQLQASAQFSYMFEVDWLVGQYPVKFRNQPLLLVHGHDGMDRSALEHDAMSFSHVTLAKARLDIPYGTHHTKMMLLHYDLGVRICIHTANMVSKDWAYKTQGLWLSPLFPRLAIGASAILGDSSTNFKKDLLIYLRAYGLSRLEIWLRTIEEHDFSAANVFLIGSVPGRHCGNRLSTFGHMKLRQILEQHPHAECTQNNWPVLAQCSSLGSLGPEPGQWLTTEFFRSLAPAWRPTLNDRGEERFHLIYPCKEDVRKSLEGYIAGASLPYLHATAAKQSWLNAYLRKWSAFISNRNRAMPHIKTYCRFHPNGSKVAWFLLTSANLSKAAWGNLEKRSAQLMIRSFELGVLFLPSSIACQDTSFETAQSATTLTSPSSSQMLCLPIPYDLPPKAYSASDRPWILDEPCRDLPDSHGLMWCPS